jgi:tRNA (guanine-N7-)-methyltransferase
MKERVYNEDFNYTHNNPYHDRLGEFNHFVLRDKEGEEARGNWNQKVFKRVAPLHLEIGTGYGHFMMDYCAKNPHINFVGMDYRFKRSFNLVKKLDAHPTKNFKYLRARGERVNFLFSENEVDSLFYFFPDPWPKTRHHKKRLFQAPFLQSAYKILRPSGKFFIKTDHDDYAKWMLKALESDPHFNIEFKTLDLYKEYPDHFLASFSTKFERIFLGKGIKIKALVLTSKKGTNGPLGSERPH